MAHASNRLQGVRTTISCIACKARKKGCDYRKPSCSRCQRLGTHCQYQTRQFQFIDVKPSEQTTSTRQPSPTSSIHSNGSLLATDCSQVIIETFWNVMLPFEGQGVDGSMDGLLSAPWIPVIREIASMHGYVRKALEACACAAVGWATDDNTLVVSASLPYMSALRDINSALQDPEQATNDAVLAGCRLLSLFEMLRKLPVTGGHSVQLTGWQTHAAGAFQLLRLRGRNQHTSAAGYQLYDGVRIMGVMQGIGQRRANDFTKLQWQLPQHDLRDELFDLLSLVPSILEDSDQVMNGTNVMERGLLVLDRYRAIGQALRAWEQRALALCHPPTSGAHTLTTEDITAHGSAFFFVCEQYWASCLATYSSRQALRSRLHSMTDNDTFQTPDWMNPEPYASNILGTAKHFFGPQAGLWAAQGAVFPLSSVLVYLLRNGRRESVKFWTITDLLQSNRAGAVMADFIHMVTAQDT